MITIDQRCISLSIYTIPTYLFSLFQHNEMDSLRERFALTLYIHYVVSLSLISRYFTYFCEWKLPDSNRRLCRIITNKFISKGLTPMIDIDQRYMFLSEYMIYWHISFLFSSTMKWTVYVNSLRSHYTSII